MSKILIKDVYLQIEKIDRKIIQLYGNNNDKECRSD